MEKLLDDEIFDIMRRILKARGMTYGDLAGRLGVSEPTIKRLFAERDCKLRRLLDICDILQVDLADLLSTAVQSSDDVWAISEPVEQELARSPSLFAFFLLVCEQIPLDYIRTLYGLQPADIALYGAHLERLGLIEAVDDGQLRPVRRERPRFRRNGPLRPLLGKVNGQFVGEMIRRDDGETDLALTMSRQMRPSTAEQVGRELQAMQQRVAKLARQDRLTSADDDLLTYKFVCVFGPVAFTDLFEIKPYGADQGDR